MIEDLKDEMNNFMQDMENTITDKKQLNFMRNRALDLFDSVVSALEEVAGFKHQEIMEIDRRQKETIKKMNQVSEKVEHISKDLYDGDEEECFEIVCPYCNYEFEADVDESTSEIVCPECENIIEIDWELDDDDSDCSGNCSGCNGCN